MLIDPEDEVSVARLVSQPYLVEVLDALTGRSLSYQQLRRMLGVRRSGLTVALRALAAHGAIRRSEHQGSWDDDQASTAYQLTDIGRRLVELLERVDVWDALYQRYLGGE